MARKIKRIKSGSFDPNIYGHQYYMQAGCSSALITINNCCADCSFKRTKAEYAGYSVTCDNCDEVDSNYAFLFSDIFNL